jgi:hypothetical protein
MSMSGREPSKGEPLTIEDFHEVSTGRDDDRRREPRFPCHKAIGIRPCRPGGGDDDDRGFRPARLLDCSVHGLGLFADEPMHAGQQFLVEFRLDRPMLAVYTVRHCRPVAGRYIVGAALTTFVGGPDEPDAGAILRALIAAGRRPEE